MIIVLLLYCSLSQMSTLLAPRQLEYKTPKGVEAAVHATQCYLD